MNTDIVGHGACLARNFDRISDLVEELEIVHREVLSEIRILAKTYEPWMLD